MKTRTRLVLVAIAAPVIGSVSSAQCRTPIDGFHYPGSDLKIDSLAAFDDGSGPALYAGGMFNTVGGVHARGIARWNGVAWSDVNGAEVLPDAASAYANGTIESMVVFDDGNGPALYVGGAFGSIGGVTTRGIAKWDGSSWSSLGSGLSVGGGGLVEVHALAVFQAPGAPAPSLYVGGFFDTAGGGSALSLARWDGTAWSSIGDVAGGAGFVLALTVHDDGSGTALYAGGQFTSIGGTPLTRVGRWNGTTWSALSTGIDGGVTTLTTFDPDGPGGVAPRLFAGGSFNHAGGVFARSIAQWDGNAWSPVSTGADGIVDHTVSDLAVVDLGTGPALYARGSFTGMGGVAAKNVARWNGTAWSALAAGITPSLNSLAGGSIATFDDGSGVRLFTAGDFFAAGSVLATDVAAWDGSAWSAVGGGDAIGGRVFCARPSTVGSINGERLFVGGNFSYVGGGSANRVAAWDGNVWSALGSGLTPSPSLPPDRCVRGLLEHDDGSGLALYAVGTLVAAGGVPASYIARWNGVAWSAVGSGLTSPAYALAAYDDGTGGGTALFTAGTLHQLWKWNGASWTIPEGIGGGDVNAMVVHDDGSGHGQELYIAGAISAIGPVAVNNVGKWRGTACGPCGTALGVGTNGHVSSLAVFDENANGTKRLFAGGEFTTAGGNPAKYVARWDGSSWSPLAGGPGGVVSSLAVFDDGTGHGPQLFAAGILDSPAFVAFVKKWENGAWVDAIANIGLTLGDGLQVPLGNVTTLVPARMGDAAPNLFVAGAFTELDGVPSGNIGMLERCTAEPGFAFCFGDGSLTTPCPCAPPDTVPNPSGGADGGCANSFQLNGAKILATGTTNPDSVVLYGARGTPVGLSIFMAGNGVIASGIAGGDGVRCAGGSFVRFGSQFAAAGNVVYPNPSLGHTLPLHAITATALGSGTTIYYQLFYRNAVASFCNPSTFNFSSAYRVTWN